ncbi:hypothetical protein BGZ80_010776 [Entomortierella chlamydospora]|uniref:Uncharacterized protein n=1 Tax=Entomortierella chlamydospora TaxID=101097 RepID=A0A9P6T4E8_9FUNG|nr:hypothetical protein BGZ80_010776 [Entomortierella chlamydospora]
MSPQVQQKGASKAKKPAVDSSVEKKTLDENEVLMKEILAMGGSEQDLELLKGIDTDSEIDEDKAAVKKQSKKGTSAKKTLTSEAIDEPKLKNEVANFMKTLFGSALMDRKKIEIAAEEEDGEEEQDDDEDDENQSEGSWETEEEEEVNNDSDEGNDSGHDSMDDLPQELKDINALLDNRKRKADSEPKSSPPFTPAKVPKKAKTEISSPSVEAQQSKKLQSTKALVADKKKGALVDIQKQVSVILGKPEPKSAKKDTKVAEPSKSKAASVELKPKAKAATTQSKPKTTAATSAPAKVAWKLGDGWSKAFEDEEDVDNFSKNNELRFFRPTKTLALPSNLL